MKRIITAAVLVPIVFALVFLPPHWQPLFVVATAVVAALAAWEYLGLAKECGANPPRIAVVVATLLLFIPVLQAPDQRPPLFAVLNAPALFVILSIGLLIYCTFSGPVDKVLLDSSSSIFCLFYTGLTLTALPALREDSSNGGHPSLVLFLLCVVWAGDIFALYIGRPWGRHKLAPSISPNKSWEGSIASVLGSMAVAGLLLILGDFIASHFNRAALSYSEDPWWYWLILAAVLNVAAQVGDLAESALKRSAGVKDSGTILPGHGGALDRIDALLLAAPVLWYAQLIHHSF